MVKVLAINENDDPSSMSYHFKKLILDAGYPVMKVFAQEHNISYSTLSRYTSGSASNPTLDFLLQMQHALQLPMDIVCKTDYRNVFHAPLAPVISNIQLPLITRQELTRWPSNREQLLKMAQRRSYPTTLITPDQYGFALTLHHSLSDSIGLFRLFSKGETLGNGSYSVLLNEEFHFALVQATVNKNQITLTSNNNLFDGQKISSAEIHSVLVQELIDHLP